MGLTNSIVLVYFRKDAFCIPMMYQFFSMLLNNGRATYLIMWFDEMFGKQITSNIVEEILKLLFLKVSGWILFVGKYTACDLYIS